MSDIIDEMNLAFQGGQRVFGKNNIVRILARSFELRDETRRQHRQIEILNRMNETLAGALAHQSKADALITDDTNEQTQKMRVELAAALAEVAKANANSGAWYAFALKLGEKIKCMPSIFPDANTHILNKVERLKALRETAGDAYTVWANDAPAKELVVRMNALFTALQELNQ